MVGVGIFASLYIYVRLCVFLYCVALSHSFLISCLFLEFPHQIRVFVLVEYVKPETDSANTSGVTVSTHAFCF